MTFSGTRCGAANLTNASCTTSSGAAHHWRAYNTSAAACSSTSRLSCSGPINSMMPAERGYPRKKAMSRIFVADRRATIVWVAIMARARPLLDRIAEGAYRWRYLSLIIVHPSRCATHEPSEFSSLLIADRIAAIPRQPQQGNHADEYPTRTRRPTQAGGAVPADAIG